MKGRGNVAGTSELMRSAIENVVRQAVLAHGGWVTAFNAEGGGLEVRIGLPVKAAGF